MRISDWSSDVCSSDLGSGLGRLHLDRAGLKRAGAVAAVGLFQAPVDHRVELAVFAVVGLSVTGELDQAGHGLLLGVFVLLIHVGSSPPAGMTAARVPSPSFPPAGAGPRPTLPTPRHYPPPQLKPKPPS